ncbi:bacterio-opsin activator domain-containing protein [Natronococcus occultus]|uniref:histidine kinase n=1 Tax=Natronococcus occultus SP4 TaxID=694430 RepID=L0JWV3_9EURY|nr:bacterio-opsin activator domain-containing protein [Natronococcus occultus]AGB36775.1 PAS domain S-box [Natronococcus occultus SP4]
MSPSAPTPTTVLEAFDALAGPGTPLTTTEVAGEFDCTNRTIYNKLDALAEDGPLETKKVGSRGRVWWRPSSDPYRADGRAKPEPAEASGRRLFENTDDSPPETPEPDGFDLAADATVRSDGRQRAEKQVAELSRESPEQYRALFESIDEGFCVVETAGDRAEPAEYRIAEANSAFEELSGLEDPVGKTIGEMDVAVDRFWDERYDRVARTGETVRFQRRIEDVGGWFEVCVAPFGDRQKRRVAILFDDSTERKRRAQLLAEQRELLERIAAGAPLEACLSELCTAVSRLGSGVRASILLADDDREAFQCPIAPDLESSWDEGLAGAPIDDLMLGTCGEAVFQGVSVTCENVADDDRWSEEWRELCLENGVRAGRSEPLRGPDGTPVGSFMLCFDEPRTPTEWEQRLVEFGTHVVEIALERERSRCALRESERRLDAFVTTTTDITYRMSPDWTELYELDGQGFIADTDDPFDSWLGEYIPEDEQERVGDAIDEAVETGSSFELEHEVLRVDGTRGWVHSRAVPVRDEDGEITEWFGTGTDVTERKRIEHELRESEERFRAIANLVPDLMWSNDPTGSVTWYNQRWFEYTGKSPEEATGDGWLDPVHPADRERSLETFRNAVEAGEPFQREHRIRRHDGEYRWFLVRARPVEDDDGTITHWFGTATDIHDEHETQASLERLSAASQELIDADSGEIADHVAALACEIFGAEHAALWRYDETTGDLERYDDRIEAGPDVDAVAYPDDLFEMAWDVFVGDEVVVARDPSVSEPAPDVLPLRSKVLIPLGRHGVLCAGSPHPDGIDERTIDLAETVGATVESAWDRAEGERQLANRNEELERLDSLNALIRGIDRALVDADSREAIDGAVCERLAESERYEFAWIGDRDPRTGAITPREFDGVDRGYLETLPFGADETPPDEDPIAEAARTGELRIVSDVAIDPRAASWRETTLDRGGRSCIAIPLVYNGSQYGVLAVYADRPQPDTHDHAVFEELGRTIAHALNAVETKRTLLTDSVIELTIDVRDADSVLSRFAREAECEIEFEGLVPQQAETDRLFFRAATADPEPIRSAASRIPAVAEIDPLRSEDGSFEFEAAITGRTLASNVVENGGIVRSLTVTDETTLLVVDLPAAASARTFVETLREKYSRTDLVSRRTRDRPITTRQDLRNALEERVTDRQREVLETAYRSGFFESPRVRTGRELSETLDITQPTFSHHLREAQRRLCEVAFENA